MGKQRLTRGNGLLEGVTTGSAGWTMQDMNLRLLRVPLSVGTTGIRTYNVSLNPGTMVLDCYLDVGTQETTASNRTINIGVTGTTAGFLALASTASVGPVAGSLTAGSVTKGSLLSEGTAASGRFSKPYLVTAASVALTSQVAEAHTEAVVDACLVCINL